MKRFTILFVALLATLTSANAAQAKTASKSSAVYSPSCSKEQVTTLAGDALISISDKQQWCGFIITLNTSKMDFGDLVLKMKDADCFQRKQCDVSAQKKNPS